MLRDEYFRRLVEASYVDLYLAGVDGARLYWPWRMARDEDSLSMSYRNACEVYWVDSKIGDSDYSNQEVLDDGFRYDSEAILLADTMGDSEETIKSIKDGLDIADDHPFDGDIVIPLQAPFAESYEEFAGESEYYAIGGLKDEKDDQKRIQAAQSVRDIAGDDIHLHGLGWGPRDGLVAAVHDNPSLIDSIDYSTPVQSSIEALPGDERMSVTAMQAATRLVKDLRRLTPNVSPPQNRQLMEFQRP